MSNLYQHLEISDNARGRLVVTGVQGELHQEGANMVSDALEADG
jgi:MerR family transcriptional regulator, light-induced transcriptional regulator